MGERRPFVEYVAREGPEWNSPRDVLLDVLRWGGIVGISVLVLVWLTHALAERPRPPAFELQQAQRLLGGGEYPPTSTVKAQAVALPDDWRGQELRGHRQAWYRLDVQLKQPPEVLWAISLPALSMNAAVFLNGELVGTGGEFDPISHNWNRPLMMVLPRPMLRSGENEIWIRLVAEPAGSGLLGRIYVGPEAHLRDFHQRRKTLKVTLPVVATLWLGALGLAAVLIYRSRPKDPVYLWFGWGVLFWAIRNLNLAVIDPPLPHVVWNWIWYVALEAWIVCIPPFAHAIVGLERPRLERALFIYAVVMAVLMAVVGFIDPYWMDWIGRRVSNSIALAIGVYPTLVIALAVWRSRDLEMQWLLISGLLTIVLGAHDFLANNGFIPRANGLTIQYSAPLVIAVFGWLLLSRYVRSINASEQLASQLSQRVEERTAELQSSHARLSDMEKQGIIQNERERILRDMHDGVGGSLAALLAVTRDGEISREDLIESLSDTLDELRLTIDSLDLEKGDLQAALSNLRARLRPLIEGGAPRLIWDCEDIPDMPALGAEQLTDVVRIVREAISNALRHAQALTITIRTSVVGIYTLQIEVKDDGQGIHKNAKTGHGQANMRRRARQIDAELEVETGTWGTRMKLMMPINQRRGLSE